MKIGIIGCGNMGQALIKGLIAKKMKDNVDNMLAAIKAKVESA